MTTADIWIKIIYWMPLEYSQIYHSKRRERLLTSQFICFKYFISYIGEYLHVDHPIRSLQESLLIVITTTKVWYQRLLQHTSTKAAEFDSKIHYYSIHKGYYFRIIKVGWFLSRSFIMFKHALNGINP